MADEFELHVDDMRPSIRQLEKELELPEGFLETLRTESDWSFVIKLHAVFEAVIVQALVGHLGQDGLADVFSKLDMSKKIAFARALDFVDRKEAKFLAALSTLRNDLAHNVRNVGFSFDAHINSLNADQLNKFVGEFSTELVPNPETRDWRKLKAFVSERPKSIIWFFGTSLLVMMFLSRKIAVYQRETIKTSAALYEHHVKAQKQTTTLADLFKLGISGNGLLSGRSETALDESPKPDKQS